MHKLSPALIAFAALAVFTVLGACRSQSNDAAAVVIGMKAKLKLPVQVDDDTRLDDVRAISKKELGYFLTLTKTTKAQLDTAPGFAQRIESTLRGGACQNPSYTTLFKAGFSVSMAYRTQDQIEAAKVVMVPKDCGL